MAILAILLRTHPTPWASTRIPKELYFALNQIPVRIEPNTRSILSKSAHFEQQPRMQMLTLEIYRLVDRALGWHDLNPHRLLQSILLRSFLLGLPQPVSKLLRR